MFGAFLLFLTGVDREALAQCPSERGKYLSLGAVMLAIASLAALGGSHLAHTFGVPLPWNLWLGGFWGVVVLILDRLILVSWRAMRNAGQEFVVFSARFLLAAALSFVINIPLQLFIFRTEIALRMETERQQKYSEAKLRLDNDPAVMDETAQLASEERALAAQLQAKDAERQQFYREFVAEAEGTAGSLVAGRGPVFAEKKQQYDQSHAEFQTLQAQINGRLDEIRQRREALKAAKQRQLDRYDQAQGVAVGLAQQVKSLWDLILENRAILIIAVPINLALFLLDIIPVLVKLQSSFHKRKPLETVIEARQAEEETEARLQIFRADHQFQSAKEDLVEMAALEHQQRKRVQMKALEEAEKQETEFASRVIQAYYADHLQRLQTDPSQYVQVN